MANLIVDKKKKANKEEAELTEKKPQKGKKNKTKRKKLIKWGIRIAKVVLYIGTLTGFLWSFKSYLDAKKQIAHLSSFEGQIDLAQQQTQEMLQKVKKHLILPEDEEPIIANVWDAESLAEQEPFYKDAKNGDKIILYPNAKKALIYRPNEDLIVNVGPVYVDENQGGQNASNNNLEELTIEIRNGTEQSEKTQEMAEKLEAIEKFEVVRQVKAKKNNYEKTVLVDLTEGDKSNSIKALEGLLNVSAVTEVPRGESESEADVVIILGQ